MRRHPLRFAALAALVLCAPPPVAAQEPAPEATLFHGGRLFEMPGADALVVVGGRITAVGALEELEADLRLDGVKRVDLGGHLVLPGFQDAHGHIEGYGNALSEVNLVGASSYAEVIERVVERAETLPKGAWVTGRGWDQNDWETKRFPNHADLTRAVPDHPVFMTRIDGHAALVNGLALERGGLSGDVRELPDIQGGRIHHDADGRATGVLIDQAMGLVSGRIPGPGRDVRIQRILDAQAALLRDGITCVHDMGVSRSTFELFRELRDKGVLKLRVVSYLRANSIRDAEALAGLPVRPDKLDRLCMIGAKLMIDGALGSRGAALLEDYADEEGARGLMLLEPEELYQRVRLLASAGMQPATHAIGDRANRVVLDVYEAVLEEDEALRELRPRIEHAQIVAPEDFERFAALGVVPSMQPTHCTSDMPWVPTRLGAERPAGSYAWRALAGPEVRTLAFGSDFPVENASVLEGLYAALTRQDQQGWPEDGYYPGQRLTFAEAVHAFTLGAARACRQEDRRGRIVPGFFCDLSVVDLDEEGLDAKTARRLLDARVVMTVINGEVVYRAE